MAVPAQLVISNAIASLDLAYANDPEGDTGVMIQACMDMANSYVDNDSNILALLASSTDYDSYIDPAVVIAAGESLSDAVQAALDAELSVLQGS